MEGLNIVSLIKMRTQIAKRENQLLLGSRSNRGDGTIFKKLHTQRLKIEVRIKELLNEIEDETIRENIRNLLNKSPASVLKF